MSSTVSNVAISPTLSSFKQSALTSPSFSVENNKLSVEIQKLLKQQARITRNPIRALQLLQDYTKSAVWKETHLTFYKAIEDTGVFKVKPDVDAKTDELVQGLFNAIVESIICKTGALTERLIASIAFDVNLLFSVPYPDSSRADIIKITSKTSLLHIVALYGDVTIARLLCSKGADVNVIDVNGSSPLSMACGEKKNHGMICFLLSEGTKERPDIPFKESVIYKVILNEDLEALELLISWEIKPDFSVERTGVSLLHLLCLQAKSKNNLRMIDCLLQQGMAIDTVKDKRTALQMVCSLNNISMAKVLVARGADVNLFADFSMTPFQIACKKNCAELVDELLHAGALVTLRSVSEEKLPIQHILSNKNDILSEAALAALWRCKLTKAKRLIDILPLHGIDGSVLQQLEEVVNANDLDEAEPYVDELKLGLLFASRLLVREIFQSVIDKKDFVLWQSALVTLQKEYGKSNTSFIEKCMTDLAQPFIELKTDPIVTKAQMILQRLGRTFDEAKELQSKITSESASLHLSAPSKIFPCVEETLAQGNKITMLIEKVQKQQDLEKQAKEQVQEIIKWDAAVSALQVQTNRVSVRKRALKQKEIEIEAQKDAFKAERQAHEKSKKDVLSAIKQNRAERAQWRLQEQKQKELIATQTEKKREHINRYQTQMDDLEQKKQRIMRSQQKELQRSLDYMCLAAQDHAVLPRLIENIKEETLCPITHVQMTNPAVTDKGNTYEEKAILEWLASNNKDPLTNQQITSTLRPNKALKNFIESAEMLQKIIQQPILWQSQNNEAIMQMLIALSLHYTAAQDKVRLNIKELVAKDALEQKKELKVRRLVMVEASTIIEKMIQELKSDFQVAINRSSAPAVCRAWLLKCGMLLEQICKFCLALSSWSSIIEGKEMHILFHKFSKYQLPAYRNHRITSLVELMSEKNLHKNFDAKSLAIFNSIRIDSSPFQGNTTTSLWIDQLLQVCLQNNNDGHLRELIQEAYSSASAALFLAAEILQNFMQQMLPPQK